MSAAPVDAITAALKAQREVLEKARLDGFKQHVSEAHLAQKLAAQKGGV
jgi:hypothetical protein